MLGKKFSRHFEMFFLIFSKNTIIFFFFFIIFYINGTLNNTNYLYLEDKFFNLNL